VKHGALDVAMDVASILWVPQDVVSLEGKLDEECWKRPHEETMMIVVYPCIGSQTSSSGRDRRGVYRSIYQQQFGIIQSLYNQIP
jgi:hypothetical protein